MTYNYLHKDGKDLKIGVYSVYFPNTDPRYKNLQSKIFNKFEVNINQIEWTGPQDYDGHPNFMNNICNSENVDYFIFFDIDAFPLRHDFLTNLIDRVYQKDTILGIEQKASHLSDSIYAGPACFVISKEFYTKLDRPNFKATGLSDVAGEVTFRCIDKGFEVSYLRFTSCEVKRWELRPGVLFGNGSIYEDLIFHNFHACSGGNIDIFIRNANKILDI